MKLEFRLEQTNGALHGLCRVEFDRGHGETGAASCENARVGLQVSSGVQ